jgi:hypothetical protein
MSCDAPLAFALDAVSVSEQTSQRITACADDWLVSVRTSGDSSERDAADGGTVSVAEGSATKSAHPVWPRLVLGVEIMPEVVDGRRCGRHL